MTLVYCPLCTSNMIPTNFQIAHGITLTPAICAKCSKGEEE
jgi:hypothetical protein